MRSAYMSIHGKPNTMIEIMSGDGNTDFWILGFGGKKGDDRPYRTIAELAAGLQVDRATLESWMVMRLREIDGAHRTESTAEQMADEIIELAGEELR